MDLELFKAVPNVEVIIDENNEPWFKRAHVGEFLNLSNIHKSLKNLDECESRNRSSFGSTWSTTPGWSGPKDQQNKTDVFLSVTGVIYVIVNSKKPRGRELKQWVLNEIIPRGLNKMIEERQQAIEARDQQLALLNGDLTEVQGQVRQLEFDNVGLQGEIRAKDQEIATLYNRHVPNAQDPGKDNIVLIVRKHTNNDKYQHLPYYCARIQKRKRYIKLRWFERHFPDHEVIVELDTPNSIHAFNHFEEEDHIERKYNHFRLVDLTREDLYDMGIPAIED